MRPPPSPTHIRDHFESPDKSSRLRHHVGEDRERGVGGARLREESGTGENLSQ